MESNKGGGDMKPAVTGCVNQIIRLIDRNSVTHQRRAKNGCGFAAKHDSSSTKIVICTLIGC